MEERILQIEKNLTEASSARSQYSSPFILSVFPTKSNKKNLPGQRKAKKRDGNYGRL